MSMTPRVSAIVPTRDRRILLDRALASIEAQTFRDLEVIVVDDGSTDGTASWLRARRPAVSLIELGHARGAAAARNRGLERARGEIVAFLDDDDIWHPAYIQTQVAALDAHPEIDLCTTGHWEVDGAGRLRSPELTPLHHYHEPLVRLLAESPIHTLSVVACRRKAFERTGPFDESLAVVHDLDWYLRLVSAGGRIQHDRRPLVKRAIPGGLVTRHRDWCREERAVYRRVFSTSDCARRHERRIRSSRSLFFARVAFSRRDLGFGVVRLAEAFLSSPIDAMSIAALRMLRWRGAAKVRVETAWESR